jgi:hypothetical protein
LLGHTTAVDGVILKQLANGGCVNAGTTAGVQLPDKFSALPVTGIRYYVDTATSSLRRCTANEPANGPIGMTCSIYIVMNAIEDFQIRYVFVQSDITGTTIVHNISDDPTAVTNEASVINGVTKRKVPTLALPYLRFVAVDVGFVVRAQTEDFIKFKNKGRRPALYDHPAANSADSFRRIKPTWRVFLPNAYYF